MKTKKEMDAKANALLNELRCQCRVSGEFSRIVKCEPCLTTFKRVAESIVLVCMIDNKHRLNKSDEKIAVKVAEAILIESWTHAHRATNHFVFMKKHGGNLNG